MHLGPARSPLVRDCVFAAVLTAATQVELVLVADEVHGSLVLQHLCFAVMTAAVALRRRAPLAAGVAGAAGLAAQTAVGVAPVVGGFLALLVVTASMGYHLSARRALVGLAVMGLAGTVYPVVRGEVVPSAS